MPAGDRAYREVADRVAAMAADADRPVLFGISGGVAVGKSTTAGRIAEHLADLGVDVELLATDAFLLPNAALAAAGLAYRKGFPESYDADLLATTLERLRAGEAAEVPVYSHATYDRVPDVTVPVAPAAVVVVEGVNALQPPAVDLLDAALYVDAEESSMVDWYLARILDLLESAEPGTFYASLPQMSPDERRTFALQAWEAINAVNLRDHIEPSRDRATWVLCKGPGHEVLSLTP